MKVSAKSGVFCAAVLASGLGGCMSTSTYGTGEAPELAIFREMTGGFGTKKQEPIKYQPRAPLVLPPSASQLPAPVETAAADPQWPEQPTAAPARDYDDEPTAAELQADHRRTKPLAAVMNQGRGRIDDSDDGKPYETGRLNRERKAFKAGMADEEGLGQGPRRFLTEPPESIRAPAATAPTEFEEIEKNKSGNFLTRLFVAR